MIRLSLYYALHSFVNQIRKIFKTWVFIFVAVCFVLGIVIGLGVAVISEAVEEKESTQIEKELEEAIEAEALEESEQAEKSWLASAFEGVESGDLIELAVGIIILAMFFMEAVGADKSGSKIFHPADVNLLFASPMKPQAVLLFRLMGQLGTTLVMSVYLVFQIPNLVLNLGVGIWAAIGFLLTWCFTVMVGKLIQVFLYTVTSTYNNTRKYLRKTIYGLILLLAAAFCIYVKATGVGVVDGAILFFNGKGTRFIPLWGWLKGFCMSVYEGNLAGALLFFGVLVVASVLFAVAIWHLKADFYEEAMAQSEEMAQLLEAASAESTGIVRRKKDRSEKIRRDAFNRGSGANVFFYRALYNRFRFAHLGFLTKTTETYVVFAVGAAAICRFALETEGTLVVIFTLGILAFYRSLGNPVGDDTSKSFFLLIPERTMGKLFWSILGGTVDCLLDVLPAMLLADLILWVNPLSLLIWLPLIVSIDFYASTVSAFINVSTPANAGKMLKQIVLILFIYFGLLPDVAILAIGILFEYVALAAVICAVVNMAIGCLFLLLSAVVMERGN